MQVSFAEEIYVFFSNAHNANNLQGEIYLTPRKPNSCCSALLLTQNPGGDILGTKRVTGDLLVS